MVNIDKILEQIGTKYKTGILLWDEFSEPFAESVCKYFKENGRISDKQLAALEKNARRIQEFGKKRMPKPAVEPERPGFLGVNCKTGEVYWHSWQLYGRD